MIDTTPVELGAAVAIEAAEAHAWADMYAAAGFIPVERHADVRDEIKAAYLATVPAGRMGTPEDIAHAVSFFAGAAAGFITGQRLVVDGGRGLRD